MPTCLLALGSNLGDPARSLTEALARLHNHPQIELLRRSGFRKTSPVGGPAGQADYLNAAAVVRTSLAPQSLLRACQEIENELGRRRHPQAGTRHWGPRTIDIDLLLYDDLVLNEPGLQIPHPRMVWRRFVLEPAAEIAADVVHPVNGWTVGRLLEHLNSTPWYLALVGKESTSLAEEVARRTGGRLLTDPPEPAWLKTFRANRSIDLWQIEAEILNPSSHYWQNELECLQWRAKQLDREQIDWTSDRLTVSNFWFDRMALLGIEPTFAERHADYLEHWRELRLQTVQPRLVALLRAPLEKSVEEVRKQLPGNRIAIEQFKRGQDVQWRRAAEVAGPVLWLDPADTQAALVELTAAVEGMR